MTSKGLYSYKLVHNNCTKRSLCLWNSNLTGNYDNHLLVANCLCFIGSSTRVPSGHDQHIRVSLGEIYMKVGSSYFEFNGLLLIVRIHFFFKLVIISMSHFKTNWYVFIWKLLKLIFFSFVLKHDDSVNERTEGSKLLNADEVNI